MPHKPQKVQIASDWRTLGFIFIGGLVCVIAYWIYAATGGY
jgi:hypothetical protein